MSRARLRHRLAPQIAAALILTSLGAGCCCHCGKGEKGEKEQAVTTDQLPPAVATTLARESAGGKVTEIEKEVKKGKTVYSADVVVDGKTWDISIAEDGTVISKELEK